MKKKEGAAGTPRARPASTGGLSLLPPPPGAKPSTLIPPPGEQLSVEGSLAQPAVAPGSGQCLGVIVLAAESVPVGSLPAGSWFSFLHSSMCRYVTNEKVSIAQLIVPTLAIGFLCSPDSHHLLLGVLSVPHL